MQFARISFKAVSALAAIAWILLIGPAAEASAKRQEHVARDFGNLSQQEGELARARQEALKILKTENGCGKWFRETDPDVAGTFESLHFEMVNEEITYIQQSGDGHGGFILKHPWAARTRELSGRGALVEFNLHSAVFLSSLPVFEIASPQSAGRYRGFHALTIGSFRGNSLAAQMTTMLHELAHVIGRVPTDDDSWDGRSSRNTAEVLRNCKSEIRSAARAAEHPENQLAELRTFAKLD